MSTANDKPVRLMVHTEVMRGRGGFEEEVVEIPRAEWEAMTEAEQHEYGTALAMEAAAEVVGSGFYVIDEPEA